MTGNEWNQLALEIQTRWPNRAIPEESFALWYADLSEFPAEQVKAAIVALYRDGREWAPNGAQVRLKLLELTDDHLSDGEAYRLAMEAAGPKGGYMNGMTWLREQSPLAAEAAEQFGWREWCLGDARNDTTRRAQFRDIYRQVVKRSADREKYRGIEARGLKVLDGGNKPRRFGDMIELAGPEDAA
jgi:hypothetical protein